MSEISGYHYRSLRVTDLEKSSSWWTEVTGFGACTGFERDAMTKVAVRHPACGARFSLSGHCQRAPNGTCRRRVESRSGGPVHEPYE